MYKFRDWIDKSKINWEQISSQTCDAAIQILEKNLDKVDWNKLSSNPAALHILENNPDKISWYHLSHNFGAFRLFHKIYEEQICSPDYYDNENEEYENEFNRDIIEDIMGRMINDISLRERCL